jgi:Domain of unknown function (DUF4160)
MYFDDHDPPHFHAIYGDVEGQISIDPIHVLSGKLPGRVISMVLEWAALHQYELKDNWQRLRADESAQKIAPLR